MLELADDLAADWFLDLWNQAPTPAKAARLRETTIERFVKAHRLRRWQAPEVLRILKQKPLSVAPGVVEAANDHIRTLTVRIRLVNQQLKAAHRKLDELCAQLLPSEENEPRQQCEQRDVVILRSMPGLGRTILAVLLAEVWQPLRRRDYHALRSLSGVAPVTRRSGKTCVVVRRYACNKRLANALYHWARVATQHDALSRRRYAALRQRGIAAAAPCAPSPTACCRWPAPCSNSRRCSTPPTRFARPPAREIRFHPFVRSKTAIP